VLAVCGRDLMMARRQKPAKFEPVVTSKCASGRPLLTDSAPPTEFHATRSKQTPKKFLTEARTQIRIFNFRPFATQNPAQLIPLSAIAARLAEADLSAVAALLAEADLSAVAALLAEAEAPDNRSAERISNRNWPANRSRRKQTIKPHLTETRITHLGSRNRISTRFWSKVEVAENKQVTPFYPGPQPPSVACIATLLFHLRARNCERRPAGNSSAVVGGACGAIQ